MKASNYIINFLKSKNIHYIFEVCGGAITHLLDSLYGRKDITAISMHHEQAAAFAAEAYSRITGNCGVAMATSGPGATNLITGIGSCFFDSTPCLFITGQVNTYEYKYNRTIRQIGFQETDIVKIVKPIVKDSIFISNPKKIKHIMEKAIYTAMSGRKGPVLIDIPMNIQRAEIDLHKLASFPQKKNKTVKINLSMINKILICLKISKRPVVVVGGGVRLSNAQKELFLFIKKSRIPVVCTLMGVDAFTHTNELFVGMLGTYGNRYANLTVANSDLLIILGARLDTRQTGTKPKTFARGAKIIHVDIDARELNSKVKVDFAINSDIKDFLKYLNNKIENFIPKTYGWLKLIKEYKRKYPSYEIPRNKALIQPNYFMHVLSKYLPKDAIICVDIGQNQMWTAQSLSLNETQRFLTQGGMGALGSAMPMAIGAAFASPNKKIIVITGDGGFQLNIQELETIYHHKLPIKIILLNNYSYGMVRQFQEQYFNSRYQSTVVGYSSPNYQDIVSAYKIKTNKILKNNEIEKSLKSLFKDKKPMFLEVIIDKTSNVIPKLSVNKPIEEQEPLLSKEELTSNMFINTCRE